MSLSLGDIFLSILIMDVEVQAEEEDDRNEEGYKGQEDQLSQQTRFLELNCELVLLLREGVALTLE